MSSNAVASAPSSSLSPFETELKHDLQTLRQALAAYLAGATPVTLAALQAAGEAASATVAGMPRHLGGGALARETGLLAHELARSGALDHPVTEEKLAAVRALARNGWTGVLASLLLVSAWQWPDAPALETVPQWLWGDYTTWLFTSPIRFLAPGQADAYAAVFPERIEHLARLVKNARGSSAVRAALEAYVRTRNGIALYFNDQNLRPHAEAHGRLLSLAYRNAQDYFPTDAYPREGRRLRIGFINRHFGTQTETFTTLPTFEHLDPQEFEVVLFAFHNQGTPLETHCQSRASEVHLLSGNLAADLEVVRAALLDVAVFGTNLTAVRHEVERLALHRVAPLQVVNNSSCISTGLPEIDLYVSGTLTETPDAAAQFTERLGLLPGPAHAFNYEAARDEPTRTFTREQLGLPAAATVFVSAANFYKLIPEMKHAWARLLRDNPGACLLVHPFNPNWSSHYPMASFAAEFNAVFAAYGVDPARLVISSFSLPSRADVKELLRVGDIYLDTFPFGGVNSLIDPLELGIPVVAWSGRTFRSRMGAALLRALALDELIASDEAGYLALAGRLARDPAYRAALRARIESVMSRQPIFLDTLAASDAFGDLLVTAFDELVRVGPAAFRADRTPLLAANGGPSAETLPAARALLAAGEPAAAIAAIRQVLRADPVQREARHLLGCALLAAGRPDRARDYLLFAMQTLEENDALLWFDLARAFQQTGQHADAISCLETSLRTDSSNLDAWVMLIETARQSGAEDIAREAYAVARQISPDDRRIAAFDLALA